jgi:hypothetical protein
VPVSFGVVPSGHSSKPIALAALGLTIGVIALGGCGSSKPGYCTQVGEVKAAAQGLGNSISSGPSAVVSAVQKLGSSLAALDTAASNELAPQRSALKSSLEALEKTAKELIAAPSSQARTQILISIPAQVGAVQTAVSNLAAAADKC